MTRRGFRPRMARLLAERKRRERMDERAANATLYPASRTVEIAPRVAHTTGAPDTRR